MSKILASLDGRRLGLDHKGRLISLKGFKSGQHGNQFTYTAPNKFAVIDDFDQGFNTTQWLSKLGTDPAAAAAVNTTASDTAIGGVLRLTTGAAGTGVAADSSQLTAKSLSWQASNGGLVFQTRIKLSAITTCWAFVGFTNTVANALQQPINSASGTTFTTTAADACGFMFDTGMTDKSWWCTGTANNVDATMLTSKIAPVAAQYQTLRIEIDATGVAVFFINGNQVGGGRMTGAITPATDLTPIISVSKLSVAASMTLDCDYILAEVDRAADGGAV